MHRETDVLLPIDLIVAILYWSLTRPASLAAAQTPTLGAVWLPTLLVSAAALLAAEAAARLTAAQAERRGLGGAAARETSQATITLYRGFLVLAYILQVQAIGWPGDFLSRSELLNALVGLAPYLVTLALSWLAFRKLDDLVTPGRWTAGRHFLFRVRYTFFVLLPWLALLGALDLLVWGTPADWQESIATRPWIVHASILGLLGLSMLLFPALMVRLWGCRKLLDGAVANRLRELQERAGVSVNRIYVWGLGGGTMLNAAALGVLPPFRYLLLSRALLEHLSEEEVAGVAAHELGHVRHRHVLWYLLVTLACVAGATTLLQQWIHDVHLLAVAVGVIVAIYFRIVFGVLSRHFERQADLFALELLGSAQPLVRSLEKIAYLSGNIREARCWHHSSIAERVAFLQEAERTPALVRQHHERCRRLRNLLGFSAALLLLAVGLTVQQELAAASRPAAVEPYAAFRHWRRVLEILPDDPEPATRLADLARNGAAPEAFSTPDAIGRFEAEARSRRSDP